MNIKEQLKAKIMEMVRERGPAKTICPSEAARAVADDWRPLMEPARRAAADLQNEDKIIVEQDGGSVKIKEADGPIRLRLKS